MAYRQYSTENADYVQAYCRHDRITDETVFSKDNITGFDAMVLESGAMLSPFDVMIFNQYSRIEQRLRKYNPSAKIYITDIASDEKDMSLDWYDRAANTTTKISSFVCILTCLYYLTQAGRNHKISRRSFLGIALGTAAYTAVIGSPAFSTKYLAENKGESWPVLPKIVEGRYLLTDSRLVSMRDAVNARKIEEYVAPKLISELGKKPKIGLIYGAAHTGIETCLKDRPHRDNLIRSFGNIESHIELPSQLDVVVEMSYDGVRWYPEIALPGLF